MVYLLVFLSSVVFLMAAKGGRVACCAQGQLLFSLAHNIFFLLIILLLLFFLNVTLWRPWYSDSGLLKVRGDKGSNSKFKYLPPFSLLLPAFLPCYEYGEAYEFCGLFSRCVFTTGLRSLKKHK